MLAGITTEVVGRLFDDMHFWKAFDATTIDVNITKRTEEARAGEERLRQASTTEPETSRTVETIFEGVAASHRRGPPGIKIVTADDTNVGETDDKSLYDKKEEDVPTSHDG